MARAPESICCRRYGIAVSIGVQLCPPIGVRPSGWTVLGRGFDRLLGVLILELYGAQISERRVEPACVVDLVDEVGKIGGDILERFVVHQMDGLDPSDRPEQPLQG